MPRPLAGPARGVRAGRDGPPYGGAAAARTKGERRVGQGHRQTLGGARLPSSLDPYPAAAAAFPGGLLSRDSPPGARHPSKFAGLQGSATPAAPALPGGRHRARPAGLPALCRGCSPVGSGLPFPGEGGGQARSLRAAPGSGAPGSGGASGCPPRPARAATALPGRGAPMDRPPGERGWRQLCAG